jgi:hypothetical protein
VFPISRFTTVKLRKAGIAEEQIADFIRVANELRNLQLLEGTVNTEKRDASSGAWLATHYPNTGDRAHFCSMHDLGYLPDTFDGFPEFHVARRERVRERISSVLSVAKP